MKQLAWDRQPSRLDEFGDMGRPADCNGSRRNGVFQDQAPADDPGQQLSQDRITVGVGAACRGNHRGHFGIAEGGAGADHAAQQERQNNGRTGQSGTDPCQSVNSGAHNRADPHGDEVRPGQGGLQPVPGVSRGGEVERLAAVPEGHANPLDRAIIAAKGGLASVEAPDTATQNSAVFTSRQVDAKRTVTNRA